MVLTSFPMASHKTNIHYKRKLIEVFEKKSETRAIMRQLILRLKIEIAFHYRILGKSKKYTRVLSKFPKKMKTKLKQWEDKYDDELKEIDGNIDLLFEFIEKLRKNQKS